MATARSRVRKVRVGQGRIGKGVIACRALREGDYLGPIRGQVYDDPEYGSDYCMQLNEELKLEPRAPFRYLNHSCDPNCALVWQEPEEDEVGTAPKLWVEVLRPIEAGSELSIDYGWEADCAIACSCGSPNCRGWIVAAEERSALLQLLDGAGERDDAEAS